MFSRKHYQAFAEMFGEALADCYNSDNPPAHPVGLLQSEVMRYFKRDNSRFDAGRFEAAVEAERERLAKSWGWEGPKTMVGPSFRAAAPDKAPGRADEAKEKDEDCSPLDNLLTEALATLAAEDEAAK